MGYYIKIKKSTLEIESKNLNKSFEMLKDLNKPENNHLKRGGSWSGGKQTSFWYSWMDENYDKICKSTKEIFEMLGFDCLVKKNGNLLIKNYDNKTGQEELFLNAIEKLFKDNTYAVFKGEDNEYFLYMIHNKKMFTENSYSYKEINTKIKDFLFISKEKSIIEKSIANNNIKKNKLKKI